MDSPSGGILGRLGEKVLGWIVLGLLVVAGVALYRNPDVGVAIWNAVWRTAVWLVIAAALPWVTRMFIARVVAMGSNWAGVILIAVLILVDLVAGLILISGWPSSGWGWTGGIAALAAAGTYNYLVTEYLAEQAGG